MLHRAFFPLFVALCLFCPVNSTSAQLPPGGHSTPGNISGAAEIRVQPKPSKVRVQVQLRSYGTTINAALKNLKARREAATTQLKKLKADANSISFSMARAEPAAYGQQNVPLLPSPSGSYGAPTPVPQITPADPVGPTYAPPPTLVPPPPIAEPAVPSPSNYAPVPYAVRPSSGTNPTRNRSKLFVASTTLQADWSLPGDDSDELVARAAAIRERVLAADLNGSKGDEALTPEDREYAEEAEMFLKNAAANGFQVPASPDGRIGVLFVYVARLSDGQRKAMLAEGCAKAKKQAEELAEAVGKQLGEPSELRCYFQNMCTPGRDFDDGYKPAVLGSWDEREAIAEAPDRLQFRCDVNLQYRIAPPAAKP